ncbi:MAG: hypothetical protein LBF56_03585 [Holosporales bacterium]|jgi:hypothetical protein|nr:hypothetical protein [Holosporales bacterium]
MDSDWEKACLYPITWDDQFLIFDQIGNDQNIYLTAAIKDDPDKKTNQSTGVKEIMPRGEHLEIIDQHYKFNGEIDSISTSDKDETTIISASKGAINIGTQPIEIESFRATHCRGSLNIIFFEKKKDRKSWTPFPKQNKEATVKLISPVSVYVNSAGGISIIDNSVGIPAEMYCCGAYICSKSLGYSRGLDKSEWNSMELTNGCLTKDKDYGCKFSTARIEMDEVTIQSMEFDFTEGITWHLWNLKIHGTLKILVDEKWNPERIQRIERIDGLQEIDGLQGLEHIEGGGYYVLEASGEAGIKITRLGGEMFMRNDEGKTQVASVTLIPANNNLKLEEIAYIEPTSEEE